MPQSSVSKTEQLQIRVTSAEKRAIQGAARRSGMTISAWVLAQALPGARAKFHQIVERLGSGDDESFALADLNDLLASLGAEDLPRAVEYPPQLPKGARLQNQVAAMVELAAGQRGVPSPSWTRDIEPLKEPVFGTTLKSLRLHLLVSAPPAFRRRNLFVDASVGDRV